MLLRRRSENGGRVGSRAGAAGSDALPAAAPERAFARLTRHVVLALVAAGLVTTALASAQDTPAPPSGPDDVAATIENDPTVPDTDYTPKGKEAGAEIWRQVAGASWSNRDSDAKAEETIGVTHYDDSLFTASFRGQDYGLVGGQRCEDSDPDADRKKPVAELGCKPVLYRFTHDPSQGKQKAWEPVTLPGGIGSDDPKPGFVGAIAWIDDERAIAVGGTGAYPRREPPTDKQPPLSIDGKPCPAPSPNEPYAANCDEAGMGRAWLMRSDGSWCEMKEGEGTDDCPPLPTPNGKHMRGMNALDCKPNAQPELCFAGGLGQLWRWSVEKGSASFNKLYDNDSPPADLVRLNSLNAAEPAAKDFRLRVRQIKMPALPASFAIAVGSGCCRPEDPGDASEGLVLEYRETSPQTGNASIAPQWFLRSGNRDAELGRSQSSTGRGLESVYSLAFGIGTGYRRLLTTSRSDALAEPRSRVELAPSEIIVPPFSTARLLSLDGAGPDWAVGELRSAKAPGRGRRGLAFAPVGARPPAHDLPGMACNSFLDPTCAPPLVPYAEGKVKEPHAPADEQTLRKNLESLDYYTATYTLNAIDMIGTSGVGYAVGDHGAIAERSSVKSRVEQQKAEPPAPRLGEKNERALLDQSAFDRLRPPVPSGVGRVPALAEMPTERLAEPRLVPLGTPNAFPDDDNGIAQIVMSRDGSEGWAIGPAAGALGAPVRSLHQPGWGGPGAGVATLYHYAGGEWRRCDSVGIKGQLEPDPACDSLAALGGYVYKGAKQVVRLTSIARVPLESDADPANDDEFEAVAVGTAFTGPEQPADDTPVVLRYRDGRWDFEERERRLAISSFASLSPVLKDVAFTAPDDGWILGRATVGSTTGGRSENSGGSLHALFHFDGVRWLLCRGTPKPILPSSLEDDACWSQRLGPGEDENPLRLTSAGDRAFLYGWRQLRAGTSGGVQAGATPLILYRDRGGRWSDGDDPATPAYDPEGGYDPGCVAPSSDGPCTAVGGDEAGKVVGLSVRQSTDRSYDGLALGWFAHGALPPEMVDDRQASGGMVRAVGAALMRLGQLPLGGRRWERFRDPGALSDYMEETLPQPFISSSNATRRRSDQNRMAVLGGGRAVVAQLYNISLVPVARLFELDPAAHRFELVQTDRPMGGASAYEKTPDGAYQAVAADNQGGAFVAYGNTPAQVFFAHYTDRPHKPVFEESPHPFGARDLELSALAGQPDGTVWAATDSSTIARYDRIGGWQTLQIPGWDAGRVVTAPAPVYALGVGANAAGIAVGKGGRIANLSPSGVKLDDASGRRCVDDPAPPCSTGYDLRAAVVSAQGAAIAAGDGATVLYRSPGGRFHQVASPPVGPDVAITGASMPSEERAWLSSSAGYVFAGRRDGEDWSWVIENRAGKKVVGTDEGGAPVPLRAIAVNDDGEGYAVGDRGVVLYRSGDADAPWRRLRSPGTDDLTAVTLPQGDGEGVLIGGRNGLIWTGAGEHLALARPADYFTQTTDIGFGVQTGPVRGLALLPGASDGEVEAWAAVAARGTATNRLYHYASDPADALLDPQRKAPALPDAPGRQPGELAFAAFGKSDCDYVLLCPENQGMGVAHELLPQRIRAELERQAAGGLALSVFTGDATDSAGLPSNSAVALDKTGYPNFTGATNNAGTSDPSPGNGRLKHRRWAEQMLDPLARAGLPTFGAVGPMDLSRANPSNWTKPLTEPTKTGENSAWREALGDQDAPWGRRRDATPTAAGYTLTETSGSTAGSQTLPDAEVDADADQDIVRPVKLRSGARTHYSVEIEKDGKKVARLIVVDTSLRSLSASDPLQNPVEPDGQRAWLERMLCFEGQISVRGRCTRERGQHAIVVSSTPTYSYGPGALDATDQEGTVLEALLLRYRASVVVSGRLGWNGRYWATAPGVHMPCPGAAYPDTPPAGEQRVCERTETDPVTRPAQEAQSAVGAGLTEGLRSLGPPPPPGSTAVGAIERAAGDVAGASGILPFVVASGAGGTFGPNSEYQSSGQGKDGYWHGYTIVRVPADGDPAGVIVEQRPILDWISLTAQAHTLRPGQRLTLRGVGREPLTVAPGGASATRYDEISTPAITHRYDLLEADPAKPYLPRKDADGNYVPLSPAVATVDSQSGRVRAGQGKQERTFAIALLSVGDKAATWPLVFEPGKSFRAKPAPVIAPPVPPRAPAPSPPQIRVLGQPPVPPPATPPPPAQLPNLGELTLPSPPALPALPQAVLATPVNPPPPPAPPAPPVNPPAQPLALNALLGQVGVNAAPIPPNAPAVNPAPPSGSAARKEAKQRQAATAKSEEGANVAGNEGAQVETADLPNGPAGIPMTRRDRVKPAESFTPLAHREQPSAWARNALYGGGLGVLAFVLAAGWVAGRPTPRRRPPEVPAPVWLSGRRH